jgi:hypothetical protein
LIDLTGVYEVLLVCRRQTPPANHS